MDARNIAIAAMWGIVAASLLLAAYFGIVSALSGFAAAKTQFAQYSYYLLSLSIGFGIQFALYRVLAQAIRARAKDRTVLAVSGTTSTAAMISCCAHYLVNVIPLLGAAGAVTLIAQYQTELFWIGIALNFLGIVFIASRLYSFIHYDHVSHAPHSSDSSSSRHA